MNRLGLFAKFWQPGTVKTRLAKSIGDQAACKIYRCFVNHLLSRHQSTGDSRCVVFSPPEKQPEFRASVNQHWDILPQSHGDLGRRMGNYFATSFGLRSDGSSSESEKKLSKLAVIGADAPLLDSSVVSMAFEMLDQVPVVIAPSHDGGYCMIAMRQPDAELPDLFSNITWSTSTVLDQTITRMQRLRIEFRLLEPLSDVDELEDLVKLKSNLQSRSRDGLDESLLQQVDLALTASKSTERETQPPEEPT